MRMWGQERQLALQQGVQTLPCWQLLTARFPEGGGGGGSVSLPLGDPGCHLPSLALALSPCQPWQPAPAKQCHPVANPQ